MKDLMKTLGSGLLVVALMLGSGLTMGCAEDSDTDPAEGTEAAAEEGGEAAEEEGGEAAEEEGGEAAEEEGGEATEEEGGEAAEEEGGEATEEEGGEAAEEGGEELLSIAATASANEDFSTLVAAASAAGLVETLDSPDSDYTIFAPTNAAFDALPEGTLDALLEDTEQLTGILLYHAVAGTVLAETVVTLEAATTLAGADITIEVTDDGVVLNGSVNVTATDILCSNGVIHVIDAVLLPPTESEEEGGEGAEEEGGEEATEMMNIVDTAVNNPDFSTLVAAVTAADLVDTLADPEGDFTVFAPTDAAFDALPREQWQGSLRTFPL